MREDLLAGMEIARKATPGPWEAEPNAQRGAWIAGENGCWAALSCGNTDEAGSANAAFIAHFNPAYVLELLQALQAGEEALRAYERAKNRLGANSYDGVDETSHELLETAKPDGQSRPPRSSSPQGGKRERMSEAELQTLRDEVSYLRLRLGDLLDQDLLRVLCKLGVTTGEAQVLAALWQARAVRTGWEIKEAIHSRDIALDANVVSVFVVRIRKKLGKPFIKTIRGEGYALSDEARRLIAATLEEDRKLVRTAFPVIASPPMPRRYCDWPPFQTKGLLKLIADGYSYAEAAKALKRTRGSVASKLRRERKRRD